MTAINQNALAKHHSIDDASNHSGNKNTRNGVAGRQVVDDSAHDSILGTVHISFHAHMRLRAYEEQRSQLKTDSEQIAAKSLQASAHLEAAADVAQQDANETASFSSGFSQKVTNMLSEVENNIVHTTDPGYQYLVNLLSNYKTATEDPQQLKEIMRKEEFYLNRRKNFMDSSDFHSYSQVLSQFSNIIERQQYSS